MALSDCSQCWETPCACASYEESDEERAFRYAWKEAKEAKEEVNKTPKSLQTYKCTCPGCSGK